uniref:uncharacterized protein KIAA1522 homolog isoform X2 n=1 Tax=Doryrhamphus excisus TaxID=161450 RepID=UPI0025ADC50B|nr:uncharacterized protein KIAA1522 homolog isoform X2 [Doryrhamphus excisus]
MSRRRSTGDLVPRDITEIIGREVRAQRGHRKPGSTLGQAFSWLRSSQKKKEKKKKKKKCVDNGALIMTDGLQHPDAAKACTKANDEQKKLSVHYSASQHFQENVFVEGSRPQYLEDLHSEAQEGLKIQQKEEHEIGGNFAEDESSASSDTAQPEQDLNSKNVGGSPEWKSNSGITDTSRTCAVPTRPGLTRQGSTFKPLYPVKRLDKSKKRNRRTTIMGIPNQVQKELALHRGSAFQQIVATNNNHQSGVFIIPTAEEGTPEGTNEGARVHLSELEVNRDKQQMRKHLQEVYKDEDPSQRRVFESQCYRSSVLRPMSVAVPGMTTFTSFNPSMSSFLLESQGPVMSISPQATYLSTIIPNAVLPASIEVIEIDRSSQTRGGGVNNSKSSLASLDSSVSPLLSRRSDGSPKNNSYNSTTAVCNSQEVDVKEQESPMDSTGDQELTSVHHSVDVISGNRETNNDPQTKNDTKIKRSSTRSLSIIKTKQPPAPPQRSNSLHSNKIRTDTKTQADNKDATASKDQIKSETNKIPNLVSNSPSTPPDTLSEINPSSPQKTPSESEKFERTMSPSSGYSSQSGTPTLSPKEITPNSPDTLKKKPVKPERATSRASSSASPSSSLTSLSSGTSEHINSDVSAKEPSPNLRSDVRELLNVPPPPKVKAPCPPPPETWAQNSRTVELLCGPSPKVSRVLKESTPMQESTVKHEDSLTKSEDLQFFESSEGNREVEKILPGDALLDQNCPVTEEETNVAEEQDETIAEVPSQESWSPTVKDSGSSTEMEPPPAMKTPQTDDVVSTESTPDTSVDETEVGSSEFAVTSIDSQGTHEVSPPPSPPPDHQPTPPLLRKSPPISVDLDRAHTMESSWPPPPPPLEGDAIFDGGDELDFPLPPPPDVVDSVSAVMERPMIEMVAPMDALIPAVEESEELIQDPSEGAPSEPPNLVLHPVVVCDKKDADTRSSCLPSSSITPSSALASSSSFLKRHSLDFEIHSTTEPSITTRLPSPVPSPSPMENFTAGVAFRRPPSTAHRDNRSKELLARHKSAPIPKEDANIPLVTPSLLQMVRLRSVSTTEDSEAALMEDKSTNDGVEDVCRLQSTPQKPIRKSIKSPPQAVKTSATPSAPSMRLQEAIRIKTAALSSREGLPCRLGMRSSYHCANEPGILSLPSCKTYDTQRFHPSTASFIFSRSTKRAPEDQSPFSDQTNWMRSDRVPPPVARKPPHGSVRFSPEPNVATSDAQQHSKGIALPETTTRVTADTIETLF